MAPVEQLQRETLPGNGSRHPLFVGHEATTRARQGHTDGPNGSAPDAITPLGERVTAEVQPQLLERPPEDAVDCTCRCGGPAEYAPFCDCPSDMACEPLIEPGPTSPGLDRGEGSDCIRR